MRFWAFLALQMEQRSTAHFVHVRVSIILMLEQGPQPRSSAKRLKHIKP
jgi:hypothetical protein